MDITWLYLYIHHKPLEKTKPLIGTSSSLVNYQPMEGTSVLPQNIQDDMCLQEMEIFQQLQH